MNRLGILLLLTVLVGCSGVPAFQTSSQPLQGQLQTQGGEQIWRGEYAFVAPEVPWQLYDVNEEDISIIFSRQGGSFPGQTAISYAEEPFGYSRELKPRAMEFLKRYLWAARVKFDPPTFQNTTWNGKPALLMDVIGHEPVKLQKSRGRVLFGYRGNRIVAFILTQWIEEGEAFERDSDQVLEKFYTSFRYVKPSIYQELGF